MAVRLRARYPPICEIAYDGSSVQNIARRTLKLHHVDSEDELDNEPLWRYSLNTKSNSNNLATTKLKTDDHKIDTKPLTDENRNNTTINNDTYLEDSFHLNETQKSDTSFVEPGKLSKTRSAPKNYNLSDDHENAKTQTGKSSVISSIYKKISGRSSGSPYRDYFNKTPDGLKKSKSSLSCHVQFDLTERQQAMYIEYIVLMNNNFSMPTLLRKPTRSIQAKRDAVNKQKPCQRHNKNTTMMTREELSLKIQERKKNLLDYITTKRNEMAILREKRKLAETMRSQRYLQSIKDASESPAIRQRIQNLFAQIQDKTQSDIETVVECPAHLPSTSKTRSSAQNKSETTKSARSYVTEKDLAKAITIAEREVESINKMEEGDRIYEIYEKSRETFHENSKDMSYEIPNTSIASNGNNNNNNSTTDYIDMSKFKHPSEIYIKIASIKDDIENMTEDEFRKLELDLGIDRRSSIISSSCQDHDDDDDDDDDDGDEYEEIDDEYEDDVLDYADVEDVADPPYSSLVTTPSTLAIVIENTGFLPKSDARMSSSPLVYSGITRKTSVPPVSVHYEREPTQTRNSPIIEREHKHAQATRVANDQADDFQFPVEKVDWIEKKKKALIDETKTSGSSLPNTEIFIKNLIIRKKADATPTLQMQKKGQISKTLNKIKTTRKPNDYNMASLKSTRSYETFHDKIELKIDATTNSTKPLSRLSAPKVLGGAHSHAKLPAQHTVNYFDNIVKKHKVSIKDYDINTLKLDNKDTDSVVNMDKLEIVSKAKVASESGKSTTSVFLAPTTTNANRPVKPINNILIPKSIINNPIDDSLKSKTTPTTTTTTSTIAKTTVDPSSINSILSSKIIIPKEVYEDEDEMVSPTIPSVPLFLPILAPKADKSDTVDVLAKIDETEIVPDSLPSIHVDDKDIIDPTEIVGNIDDDFGLLSESLSLPNINRMETLSVDTSFDLSVNDVDIELEREKSKAKLTSRKIVKKTGEQPAKPSDDVHPVECMRNDTFVRERSELVKIPERKKAKNKRQVKKQTKLKLPTLGQVKKSPTINLKESVIPGFDFNDKKYTDSLSEYKIKINTPPEPVRSPSNKSYKTTTVSNRSPSPVYLPTDIKTPDIEKIVTVPKKKLQMAGLKPKRIPKIHVQSTYLDETDPNIALDDWLAKWCIFNPNQLKVLENVFDQFNYTESEFLKGDLIILALNQVLTLNNLQLVYLERVLSLCNMRPFQNGANKRTFCIIAALAQRIDFLDDIWFNGFLPKLDMISVENKLFKVKKLWDYLVNKDTKLIKVYDLLIEMRAGGVTGEHIKHASEKFSGSLFFDLLDYLVYIPLFVLMHETIVQNPLHSTSSI